MGQNLEQYKDMQGVKEEHFVDREARPHQVGYHFPSFFFFQSHSFPLSSFTDWNRHTGFPLGVEK